MEGHAGDGGEEGGECGLEVGGGFESGGGEGVALEQSADLALEAGEGGVGDEGASGGERGGGANGVVGEEEGGEEVSEGGDESRGVSLGVPRSEVTGADEGEREEFSVAMRVERMMGMRKEVVAASS